MVENINGDLTVQFKSSFTSSPRNEPHKGVFNFSYDLNSHSVTKNSFELIIQNGSQCFYKEIEKNDDDSDMKNEDLLLGTRDEEHNVFNNDEYDLTEEEEDLLLGIRDEKGNFVFNNDEYDLTEEEENYLLSDDCNRVCIKNSNSNLNKYDSVTDEENFFFIDVKPSVICQNKAHDEHEVSCDTTNSLKNNFINNVDHLNLHILSDQDCTNKNVSAIQMQQIQMKNMDTLQKENLFSSSNDENISISNSNEEEIFVVNALDDDSISLYKESFAELTEKAIFKNTRLSPKDMLIDSSIPDNDKSNSNEKLKIEVNAADKEFDLSKVMSSDSARKIYLALLKDKTQSLMISYNKYKNSFLQSSPKMMHELSRKGAAKKETNISSNHHKREEINLIHDNVEVSAFNVQPLNNFIGKVNEGSIDHCKNRIVNQVENVNELPENDPTQKRSVKNVRQLYAKNEIHPENPNKIVRKATDKLIKDIDDKNTSDAFMDKETACDTNEFTFYNAKESTLCGVLSESKNSSVSLILEQQQKISMEDSYNLQTYCMSNPLSIIKKNFADTRRNVLEKITQAFSGSKYSVLNSYVEYESMDFQLTSEDSNALQYSKNFVSNTKKKKTKVLQSSSKIQKKKTSTALRQSKRISALRNANLNSKPLRAKPAKKNDNTQSLLDLFSLNNKIVTYILRVLLSDKFKTGALLTDILKYLRRERELKIASKLRKDVENFLKAAVDAGIAQMKCRRYVLTRVQRMCNRRKSAKKTLRKYKDQSTSRLNLRKRQK